MTGILLARCWLSTGLVPLTSSSDSVYHSGLTYQPFFCTHPAHEPRPRRLRGIPTNQAVRRQIGPRHDIVRQRGSDGATPARTDHRSRKGGRSRRRGRASAGRSVSPIRWTDVWLCRRVCHHHCRSGCEPDGQSNVAGRLDRPCRARWATGRYPGRAAGLSSGRIPGPTRASWIWYVPSFILRVLWIGHRVHS